MPCELLSWDTEWWGCVTARVTVPAVDRDCARVIDDWCELRGVELLYFLCPADDLAAPAVVESAGYRLVDLRTTLNRQDSGIGTRDAGRAGDVEVRTATDADVPALGEIAASSYRLSRFYADPHLPEDRCEMLYRTWIRLECEGAADIVLIATDGPSAIGYISCHADRCRQTGRIGLFGVAESYRRSGVGSALLCRALEWFDRQGTPSIDVVTQGRNIAAQRLYQRSGFLSSNTELWFHKWYSR